MKKPFYRKGLVWLAVIAMGVGVAGSFWAEQCYASQKNAPKQEQAKKKEKKADKQPKTPTDKIKSAAKKAGMTKVKVEDKGNGVYVIKTQAPESFSNSQYASSIPTDIADVLKRTKDVDFKSLYFDFQQKMVDDKGQKFTNPALLVLFTKDTVNSINLDNWPADPMMVYKACTAYSFDPYPWREELKQKTKSELVQPANGVSNLQDEDFKMFTELKNPQYR